MVKARKPTGTTIHPTHLTCAKEIDDEINCQAGTRDIKYSDGGVAVEEDGQDREGDDEKDEDEPSEMEVITAASKCVRTETVCSNQTVAPVACPVRGGPAAELSTMLTRALDPAVQHACDKESALHSFQTTQLHTYSEQLQDAHAAAERLCAKNLALLQCVSAAECERDLAQLELWLENSRRDSCRAAPTTSKCSKSSNKQHRCSHFNGYPGLDCHKGKVKVVETFSEGYVF